MANFKFEGDLTGLSARQLEFVSSVLNDRDFSNDKVLVTAVGNTGDGFVANVKRFTIEKNGMNFKMIAKVAPVNETLRAQMNAHVIFKNEHIMYTEVLPKFTEIEKEAEVPEVERLRYATCYGSLVEEPNEIILLEDLEEADFVMLDKHASLTDVSVKLILKSFASLHSLSYVLKKQEPETYDAVKDKLGNLWGIMKENEEMNIFFAHLEDNMLSMLDNAKHKELVKGSLTRLLKGVVKNLKADRESKYSVIQQGDAWTNNILFKLEGNSTVQCCMIDYQLSHPDTPVADIQHLIFNCTDYEHRAKYYHDWIDYYYNELEKCLTNFGLKANYIYPKDQLDADLKRFAKFSLGFTLMQLGMLMSESHEAAKFKEAMESENGLEGMLEVSKLSNMDNSTLTRIKDRVVGLINSFIELGYLNHL